MFVLMIAYAVKCLGPGMGSGTLDRGHTGGAR